MNNNTNKHGPRPERGPVVRLPLGKILMGDVRDQMARLPDESIHSEDRRGSLSGSEPEPLPKHRVIGKAQQRARERFIVADRHEQAGLAVDHQVHGPPGGGGSDRTARRRSF